VATDPEPALRRVTEAGFDSWSLDLIFAVPGQTLDDLDRDLDAVERLSPPHVALYGLTIEPGTPFERAVRSGRMATVDEAHWRRMYDHLVDRLSALGLQRYEVSNFARPGHHSRHNRLYWSDRPYMGLGPSAHGYLPDGRRYVNAPRLPSWLPDPVGTAQEERPTPEQRLADLLVSGLRAAEGVDLEHARRQTGLRLDPGRIERLVPGLVELHDGRVRLTDAGVPLCDAVVARLLEHAVTK
jgi:oxygen-independent coproporphyrinogen-3 oxidase